MQHVLQILGIAGIIVLLAVAAGYSVAAYDNTKDGPTPAPSPGLIGDDPDCKMFDLTGLNFNGANFTGRSLDNIDWTNSTFVGASFVNVSFPYTVLFAGVDCAGADFTNATFPKSDSLSTGVMLEDASFAGADFINVTMPTLWKGTANFAGANFSGADFSPTITGVDGVRANFTGADFRNSNWNNGIQLTDLSIYRDTNWAGQTVDFCKNTGFFDRTDWSNAIIGAWLNIGVWDNADFSGITIGCDARPFEECVGSTFHATVRNADFTSASLQNMDFTAANLSGSVFRNAVLTEVTFTSADLSNVDFTGANVTAKSLSSAIWHNTTCPDGTNSDNSVLAGTQYCYSAVESGKTVHVPGTLTAQSCAQACMDDENSAQYQSFAVKIPTQCVCKQAPPDAEHCVNTGTYAGWHTHWLRQPGGCAASMNL